MVALRYQVVELHEVCLKARLVVSVLRFVAGKLLTFFSLIKHGESCHLL